MNSFSNNRIYLITVLTIIVNVFLSCNISTDRQVRLVEKFDRNWKFSVDDFHGANQIKFADDDWETITLPHRWSVEKENSIINPSFIDESISFFGIGWYRKSFLVSNKLDQKSVYIRFDGIYKNSTVWINGHLLGNRPNGYVEIQYDITQYLNYGNKYNIIAVRVDNSDQTVSGNFGIYRHVWIEYIDKTHIDRWGVAVSTPKVSNKKAIMAIETQVVNDDSILKMLELTTTVINPLGEIIENKKINFSINPGENSHLVQNIDIDNPMLWSINSPEIYTIKSVISFNNKDIDTDFTTMGIRKFNFNANKGFSLNGEQIKIKGVSFCQADRIASNKLLINQFKALKTKGVNAVRFTGNPTSSKLLSLCDSLGFIVITEAFNEWGIKKMDNNYDGYHNYFNEWYKTDLTDMILRDRNHPSVIMYSIGNDVSEQRSNLLQGAEIAKELVDLCHSIDPTRPITSTCDAIDNANTIGFAQALDVVIYDDQESFYEEDHIKYPNRIIIGSRTGLTFDELLVTNKEYVIGEFIPIYIDEKSDEFKFDTTNKQISTELGMLNYVNCVKQ